MEDINLLFQQFLFNNQNGLTNEKIDSFMKKNQTLDNEDQLKRITLTEKGSLAFENNDVKAALKFYDKVFVNHNGSYENAIIGFKRLSCLIRLGMKEDAETSISNYFHANKEFNDSILSLEYLKLYFQLRPTAKMLYQTVFTSSLIDLGYVQSEIPLTIENLELVLDSYKKSSKKLGGILCISDLELKNKELSLFERSTDFNSLIEVAKKSKSSVC